jgi:DNA-binding transcriptional ArsR family regulator
MEETDALAALSALSQPLRLAAFRKLVVAGGEGMAAGALAAALGARSNTLSSALALLQSAGLVRSERQGRSIRYFARMDGVRGLLAFLIEDCCRGAPEICRPALEELMPGGCGC